MARILWPRRDDHGQTSVATLEFLIDYLRWCLEEPAADGPRAWAARVSRAVGRVEEAFDRHVKLFEAPGGPFDQVADPSLLPFAAREQEAGRLRQQHAALRTQIRCVGELFRNCLLLCAPPPGTSLMGGAAEELAARRALRLFAVLGPCVGDLLAGLAEHLAAENRMLGYTASGRGPRHVRRATSARP
jgi:hypothetical protein